MTPASAAQPPFEGAVARRTVEGAIIEWLAVPPRAAALGLEPHPEGGWYRRTWTSPASTTTAAGERPAATLIHFLLPPGEASAWHRVTSDEIWLWHGADPLTLELGGSGDQPDVEAPEASRRLLDRDTAQALVPAGVWQRTLPSTGEVLVSCLVSPGFSFADFALADSTLADFSPDD